ncbi:hypothetical protein MY04_4439 [Flammeovirga sp. MY04]|uniref:hypothetical protein n=1 Tax=Flammeovirga sp. MY04 TaxID=1191459 RepID=UPI00130536EB|nr:hypothetical protein [Flammeovirga sp. MY04]ANQ51775.2 hypothetical protein MY04_4439 [Flammeovirga sp. MY04]
MGKKIFLLVIFATISIGIYLAFFSTKKTLSKDQIMNAVAEKNVSGSGYRDLEGKFIEYEYVDFGKFGLAIYDNKIKWRGYGGYFDGIVSMVEPQITKVSDYIYFLSWVFGDNGGDNVVVNFKSKKVFAHLRSGNANDESPSDFEMIHGTVLCGPSTSCKYPEGDPISMLHMVTKLNLNTMKFDLPTIFETKKPLIQANKDARNDLLNYTIQYQNDIGTVHIQVLDEITKVSINGGEPKEYQTNVTKIDEDIYFISWLGNKQFGKHIVLNKKTNKVFDHMASKMNHVEQIYDLE